MLVALYLGIACVKLFQEEELVRAYGVHGKRERNGRSGRGVCE